MQPSRIRSTAVKVLRRSQSGSLSCADLTTALAQEGITMTAETVAETLRDHDAIILLEWADPLGELPLLVREQEPAYHAALGTPSPCYAVVYSGDDAGCVGGSFGVLAAPLLQAWRDAGANPDLRREIASALGALYVLTPVIEDASREARP